MEKFEGVAASEADETTTGKPGTTGAEICAQLKAVLAGWCVGPTTAARVAARKHALEEALRLAAQLGRETRATSPYLVLRSSFWQLLSGQGR